MRRLWLAVWVPILCAQVVPDRYIVELQGRPAASRTRLQEQRRIARAEQASLRPRIDSLGARVLASLDTVVNALVVEIPARDAPRLASLPGVARVHPVRLAKPFLDRAIGLHKVPDAWAAIGGMGNAGAGIKIAIIDSGIALDHPGFQDDSLPMPPGFPLANQPRDLAYTNRKVIVARNYVPLATPQDAFGHGTAVAMEAAGMANNGPLGVIAGVAPKAWLGSYKVYQNENPFGEDTVLQAIEDAVNDGMDVINLSLGVAVAPRLSDDLLVAAVERASALGVLVSVAAGNSGDAPNTIASPATAPSAIAVGASSNDRMFAPGLVRLGGNPGYYAIPAYGPMRTTDITAPVADVAALDGTGEACSALPAGSLTGRVALIARSPQSRPCAFAVKLNNAQAAGAIAAIVYMNPDNPDLVAINVGNSALPAVSVDLAAAQDLRAHLRDGAAPSVTVQFTTSPLARNPNAIAPFSARGPSADAGIKPDLVATGLFLYTATQKTNPQSVLYGATGYVKEADGTSFAAPLVTGAAALLRAARPGLTAAQYRSLLVNSAAPLAVPVQWTGAGILNVAAALANTVAVSPVSLSFGAGSATIAASTDLTITNLGAVADTFTLSAAPAVAGPALSFDAGSLRLAPGASQKVTAHLAGSSLVPGEYAGSMHIRGTVSPVDTVVPYWYAVPDRVPKFVALLQVPEAAASGSEQEIYFRVTDLTGLPLPGAVPTVRVAGGTGSVLGVSSVDAQSPGVFHAIVLLDPQDGLNLFEIDAGSVAQRIAILGQTQ